MSTPVYDVTPQQPQQAAYQSDPTTLRRLDAAAAALNRFQGKTAIILIFAGLLVILVGYSGASSATVKNAAGVETVSLIAQFPYLISGGILGFALVVIGVGLLIVQSARANAARQVAAMDRLGELLAAGGAISPRAGGSAVATPDDVAGLVVAGSASFHAPDCRLVEGRGDATYLLPVEAVSRGLQACRVCSPATV